MKSIEKLAERASTLSTAESAIFDRIIAGIDALVFHGSNSPEARRKVLSEIERYLMKKSERPTKDSTGDRAEYLRFVRNALAHKSNIPTEVVRPAIPMFWTVLSESAPLWDAKELSNLLAYAIRSREEYPVDSVMTTSSVIRHYQALLKRIPIVERNEVFKELLLSIFVTPQFQDAMTASKSESQKKRGDNFAN